VKVIAVLIGIAILVLSCWAFTLSWYVYLNAGIQEAFRGVQGIAGDASLWVAWTDSGYPHLKNLYLIVYIVLIVGVAFQILLAIFALLLLISSCLPLKFKLAIRFLKNKLRRGLFFFAILVCGCLAFCTFFFMTQHPSDLNTDQHGICLVDQSCTKFSGNGFGPGQGWKFVLIAFILSIIQAIVMAFYALRIFPCWQEPSSSYWNIDMK